MNQNFVFTFPFPFSLPFPGYCGLPFSLLWWNEVRDTCVRPTSVMETSKEEQIGVVRFLTAAGVGEREINRRMSFALRRTLRVMFRVHWNGTRDCVRTTIQRFGYETLRHPP